MSNSDDEAKRNYKVGRGRPPKEHQFKPGFSGNPRGRPRQKPWREGDLHRCILAELQGSVLIKEGDTLVRRRVTTIIAKRIIRDAMLSAKSAIQLLPIVVPKQAALSDVDAMSHEEKLKRVMQIFAIARDRYMKEQEAKKDEKK